MKMRFKENTMHLYTFRDLEYALDTYKAKLKEIDDAFEVLKKYKMEHSQNSNYRERAEEPIFINIRIIESELTERMLTGNDDGMLERELLGVQG